MLLVSLNRPLLGPSPAFCLATNLQSCCLNTKRQIRHPPPRHLGWLWIPAFAPFNPPAEPSLPLWCRIRQGLGPASWKKPLRHLHIATWLPTVSAAMGMGFHSIAAFSPSGTWTPPPEEEILAGEALMGATDQMTQRPSSEHVLPCPLDADTGNQHRHELRRSWVSPSFTSLLSASSSLQVQEEH